VSTWLTSPFFYVLSVVHFHCEEDLGTCVHAGRGRLFGPASPFFFLFAKYSSFPSGRAQSAQRNAARQRQVLKG
jgi:hypothetical protein